jgi:hypothetical protein
MEVNGIIRGIDEELARLREVRALLTGNSSASRSKKRHMSAEARERIAGRPAQEIGQAEEGEVESKYAGQGSVATSLNTV